MTKIEELMALADALDRDLGNLYVENERLFAAAALREYAALLDQEPAAWIQPDHLQKAIVAPFLCRVEPTKRLSDFKPIYTHPPKEQK